MFKSRVLNKNTKFCVSDFAVISHKSKHIVSLKLKLHRDHMTEDRPI